MNIITLAWTLYLIVALVITTAMIFDNLANIRNRQEPTLNNLLELILCASMWAIWYMYFIH